MKPSTRDVINPATEKSIDVISPGSAGDFGHAVEAARLRIAKVHLNGAWLSFDAPFGGYKQPGDGREWGTHGFEEFLETKALLGYWEG